MGILQKIAEIALSPSVAIGNVISDIIKAGSGKTTAKELSETTAGKALGAAIAGTAAALAVAAGAPAVVKAVKSGSAKSAISKAAKEAAANPIKAVKKAATAVVGAAVVGGAVAGGGAKLIKPVIEAAYKGTKTAAEVATGEKKLTSETVMDVAKTIGIIGGSAIVGGAVGIIAEKVMGAKESAASETPMLSNSMNNIPTTSSDNLIYDGSITEGIPMETTTVTTGTKKKRKARARTRDLTSVRQNVNVIVNNRAIGQQSRKYIKESIYA